MSRYQRADGSGEPVRFDVQPDPKGQRVPPGRNALFGAIQYGGLLRPVYYSSNSPDLVVHVEPREGALFADSPFRADLAGRRLLSVEEWFAWERLGTAFGVVDVEPRVRARGRRVAEPAGATTS